jgi:hypothetical protein
MTTSQEEFERYRLNPMINFLDPIHKEWWEKYRAKLIEDREKARLRYHENKNKPKPWEKGKYHEYLQQKKYARWEEICLMRLDGLSYAAIGKKLGVSKNRISQLAFVSLMHAKYEGNPLNWSKEKIELFDKTFTQKIKDSHEDSWKNKAIGLLLYKELKIF